MVEQLSNGLEKGLQAPVYKPERFERRKVRRGWLGTANAVEFTFCHGLNKPAINVAASAERLVEFLQLFAVFDVCNCRHCRFVIVSDQVCDEIDRL